MMCARPTARRDTCDAPAGSVSNPNPGCPAWGLDLRTNEEDVLTGSAGGGNTASGGRPLARRRRDSLRAPRAPGPYPSHCVGSRQAAAEGWPGIRFPVSAPWPAE